MKFLVALIFLFPSVSNALCDYSSDIKEQNGSFLYSKECHAETGKNYKKVTLLNEKVSLLETKIELKDSQLFKTEDRAKLWMDTATELNEKLAKYESTKSNERWIQFGLGMAAAFVSVWGAGQLAK